MEDFFSALLHARLFADTRPLTTIQMAGIEQLRVFFAKSPFLVGIGVQRVMDERIHLHLLPPQLVLGGHWSTGLHLRFQHDGDQRDQHE